MPISLNARFEGASPPDPDGPHPPGAGIARALEAALRHRGLAVEPIDNWRDVGWVIGHGTGADALEIALARTALQHWMLQVSARERPGLIARVMGRPAPDPGPAIYELALETSASLVELGFTGLAWRWDGPPHGGDPPEPPPPA